MSETPLVDGVVDGLVDGLRSFRARHHGATAVIEHIGRRGGARIVLVGEDGAEGAHAAPATDVARAACEQAGVPVENGWFRELTESGGIIPRSRRGNA